MIQSLLQYESFNQNIFDPSKTLQLASSSSSLDISNLIALYESRTNLIKVIKDLNLNIDIQNLDHDESIDIKIFSDSATYNKFHKLKFSFSDIGYALLDKDLNELQTSNYGQEIVFEDLKILVKSANLKNIKQ